MKAERSGFGYYHLVHETYISCTNRVRRILAMLPLLLSVWLVSTQAMGEPLIVEWEPNPEDEVAGYLVHYGDQPRQYSHYVDVSPGVCAGQTCSAPLELPPGHWFIAVTAYNTSGMESELSEELHALVGVEQPVLIYPNGTLTWVRGCTYEILWENFIGNKVALHLLKDGVVHRRIAKARTNNGVAVWTVDKKVLPGSGFQVMVSGGGQIDVSDESVQILAPTILSPDMGVLLRRGESHLIQWERESFCGSEVSITLEKPSKRKKMISWILASSAPNIGEAQWEIPLDLIPGTKYRVRVQSLSSPSCYGYSNAYFTIE